MASKDYIVTGPNDELSYCNGLGEVWRALAIDPDDDDAVWIADIVDSYEYVEYGDYSVEVNKIRGCWCGHTASAELSVSIHSERRAGSRSKIRRIVRRHPCFATLSVLFRPCQAQPEC